MAKKPTEDVPTRKTISVDEKVTELTKLLEDMTTERDNLALQLEQTANERDNWRQSAKEAVTNLDHANEKFKQLEKHIADIVQAGEGPMTLGSQMASFSAGPDPLIIAMSIAAIRNHMTNWPYSNEEFQNVVDLFVDQAIVVAEKIDGKLRARYSPIPPGLNADPV